MSWSGICRQLVVHPCHIKFLHPPELPKCFEISARSSETVLIGSQFERKITPRRVRVRGAVPRAGVTPRAGGLASMRHNAHAAEQLEPSVTYTGHEPDCICREKGEDKGGDVTGTHAHDINRGGTLRLI